MQHTIDVIRNEFIELKKSNLPISYYLIRKSILNAVAELKLKINGRVLDLGCGIMPYKEFLNKDKALDYLGIDIEPTEYHNTVKPDYYWNGETIPFDNDSFDFVIATEFLEHYFDTSKILKEIQRVLKPGGTFFFTVPNVWPIHEAPFDYHRFTPFSLEQHFKESMFSSWDIMPLGNSNYHLAISLAIWFDNSLPKKYLKFVKPFFNIFLNFLVKKDKKSKQINNGLMYSGLYGFVIK